MESKTVADLKVWAAGHKHLAIAVLEARAFADLERERVSTYIAPVFARFSFKNDDDGHGDGSPITDREQLHLSDDDDQLAAYYAACDAAHREHGFTGGEGCCPALIAEGLQVGAERALVLAMGEFMGVGEKALRAWDKSLQFALDVCLKTLV